MLKWITYLDGVDWRQICVLHIDLDENSVPYRFSRWWWWNYGTEKRKQSNNCSWKVLMWVLLTSVLMCALFLLTYFCTQSFSFLLIKVVNSIDLFLLACSATVAVGSWILNNLLGISVICAFQTSKYAQCHLHAFSYDIFWVFPETFWCQRHGTNGNTTNIKSCPHSG